MLIFDLPFGIANEVVKRSDADNRRIIESPKRGGNNLFYLGTPQQFINRFNGDIQIRIIEIQAICQASQTTLQKGQGIKVKHAISKNLLLSFIPFIEAYLNQYEHLYHNPHFNSRLVSNALNNIEGEALIFYSDLTFIKDSLQAKPYFKWFNYEESIETFKLVQEFLIPRMSFLNFEYLGFENNEITIEWLLSYTDTVIYSCDSVEQIVNQSIDRLSIITPEQKETIREALVKIRIGQSQFRTGLLNSPRNSCLFTGITEQNLLIASHIKPWKNSNNEERLDIQNGVLLTPTFDKLFDKFLITFNDQGGLIWSQNRLSAATTTLLQNTLSNDISIEITDSNASYFEFHRNKFNELEAQG